MKKFEINCCEAVNFRPILSEDEILICNNVVGNSRAILLSLHRQRNTVTDVHKTLTQVRICGTVLIVAVSASPTKEGNLSHFNFQITQLFSIT